MPIDPFTLFTPVLKKSPILNSAGLFVTSSFTSAYVSFMIAKNMFCKKFWIMSMEIILITIRVIVWITYQQNKEDKENVGNEENDACERIRLFHRCKVEVAKDCPK